VCRSLSVRYLWIDSLCIIQDSKEDWAREAANMAYVYSNSYLTISADWSPNSEGGCYKANNLPQGINSDKAIHLTSVLSNGEQSFYTFQNIILLPMETSTILTWLVELGSTKRDIYLGATSISHKTSSFGNAGEDLLVKTWCPAIPGV
jgi:hypothetical protein